MPERRGWCSMRMRSTGLGNTELVGDISGITRTGRYLILHVNTTDPVRWHVRSAMNVSDLFTIVRLILRPSSLTNIFKAIIIHIFRDKEEPPSEF